MKKALTAACAVTTLGPLPSTGGSFTKSLPIIDVLGLISAKALQVEKSGRSKVAKSKARLVELNVGPIDLGELPLLLGIFGDLNRVLWRR